MNCWFYFLPAISILIIGVPLGGYCGWKMGTRWASGEELNKLYVLLTHGASAAMMCAIVTMIMDGPHIYIYIFAPPGMVLSVLGYIVRRREIAAMRRVAFRQLEPSLPEEEWLAATHNTIPPQLLGNVEAIHKVFKMPEEWDALVAELRDDQ